MKLAYNFTMCAAIGLILTIGLALGGDQTRGDFDFLRWMEGSWECRTTDLHGNNHRDPNIVEFVRLQSKNALYEEIRGIKKDFSVYQYHPSGVIVKVEICQRADPSRPTVTTSTGKYDTASRSISWHDSKGELIYTWIIRNRDEIEIDLVLATGVKQRESSSKEQKKKYLWSRIK